jgi:hypothetical protein
MNSLKCESVFDQRRPERRKREDYSSPSSVFQVKNQIKEPYTICKGFEVIKNLSQYLC